MNAIPSKLNIAVLCVDVAHTAATIHDHLRALTKNSRHHAIKLPINGPAAALMHLDLFDVLVVHYTILMKDRQILPPALRERISRFRGVKAAFIQDEYRCVDATAAALAEFGIDLLFTCVPDGEIEKVYPTAKLPGLKKINVLTGYVPPGLASLSSKSFGERSIDVGYRSRKVPDWLGEFGLEKSRIAERFAEDAPHYGLKVDLSCREEDRIYGKAWNAFVGDCKAVLGVESGASVFDFAGDIQSNVEAYLQSHPEASFQEVQQRFFLAEEGKIRLNQISPRCFEAAALRTLMINYEGEYSGILQPWRHFVPLKKDHSNMAEVVAVLRDESRAAAIVQAAYDEVARNPKYSYQALSDLFDREVSDVASRKTIPGHSPVWPRTRIALSRGASLARRAVRKAQRHATAAMTDVARSVLSPIWRRGLRALLLGPGGFNWEMACRHSRLTSKVIYPVILAIWTRLFPLLPPNRRRGLRGARKSVVFLHNSYYHFFLLAKELRRRGWYALSISLDAPDSPHAQFFHGEDINLHSAEIHGGKWIGDRLVKEIKAKVDAVHFYGVGMMHIDPLKGEPSPLQARLPDEFLELKRAGVKIAYSVVGCNDGVSQSEWRRWSGNMCSHCRFENQPSVCSDMRNLAWGYKLASVCDLICAELMPRLDYLASDKTVTVPLSYCVDEAQWHPELEVPPHFRVERQEGEVLIMHGVGNFKERTKGGADPKGTHAIIAAVDRLRAEGAPVRLHFIEGVASRDMRYLQVQADIVVDQLLFGRYGAQARESLMLGRPVVGNMKWDPAEEDAETLRFLEDCPVVHATPATVYQVLKDLVADHERRTEIGRRSRAFALQWHSVKAVVDRFEREYSRRLGIGEPH